MNISKQRLKEIIKEEIQSLLEKTLKTKSGLKFELTRKGGYELLRIHGFRGYVEVYGRNEIKDFVSVLRKNFRIV